MTQAKTGVIGSLADQIKDLELLPIPVTYIAPAMRLRDVTSALGLDRPSGEQSLFQGTLTEFLDTAKKLDARGIYFAVDVFSEEQFSYASMYEDDTEEEAPVEDEDTAEEEPPDLAARFPELAPFKAHVGEPFKAFLSTAGGVAALSYEYTEGWAVEFEFTKGVILQNLAEQEEVRREKEAQEQETKDEELVKMIRSLQKDEDFNRCRTQRAMMTYALEHHPELEELDRAVFKSEIQRLWDLGH